MLPPLFEFPGETFRPCEPCAGCGLIREDSGDDTSELPAEVPFVFFMRQLNKIPDTFRIQIIGNVAVFRAFMYLCRDGIDLPALRQIQFDLEVRIERFRTVMRVGCFSEKMHIIRTLPQGLEKIAADHADVIENVT